MSTKRRASVMSSRPTPASASAARIVAGTFAVHPRATDRRRVQRDQRVEVTGGEEFGGRIVHALPVSPPSSVQGDTGHAHGVSATSTGPANHDAAPTGPAVAATAGH